MRLLVEGSEDKRFFVALFSKLSIPITEDEINSVQGKQKLKDIAVSLIRYESIDYLIIAEDLDTRNADEIKKSWRDSLTAKLSSFSIFEPEKDSFEIKIDDTKIVLIIIPMGLPEDKIIRDFGITRFMMEDYIIKILLANPELFYQKLNFKISNSNKLREKILEILTILRNQNILMASSKDIFTLMRVLVCDMPPHTFISNVLSATDNNILKAVLRNIIDRLMFLRK